MNFYNMNKNIGLAQNIDADNKDFMSYNTNIFTVSDDIQSIFSNFLSPNIKRKLGSYVIFDQNNNLYNLCKDKFQNYGYQTERYSLTDTFNVFNNVNGEDEIQALVNVVLRNSTPIQKFLYEGHTEVDLLYSYTDLILNLIIIYLVEKAPHEKQSFDYINKILRKLNQSDLEYFKKIFGKVDSSYKIQTSMFHLKYMKEDEYKQSLSILTDILGKTSDTAVTRTTIIENIESLYTNRKLKLIFVELTGQPVVDSFFCSYVENNCYKADVTKKAIPIFYLYAPLEKVGYISRFDKLITNYERRNDIHILNFHNLITAIKLYGKDIRTIMKDIHYGLLFQTNNEKNIKYTQKLLSDSNIGDMMEQILVNLSYCVLYRNQVKTSIEPKLTEDEEVEKASETTNTSSDSASEALQKFMDSLDTNEELIDALKKDIDSEPDSIKRQHFINLYNNFVE
ncbi:MAG: hypothetical protein IJH12_10275 [Clostridia bacterium]|nr:hypothetical protein [Clostridia bacterium]